MAALGATPATAGESGTAGLNETGTALKKAGGSVVGFTGAGFFGRSRVDLTDRPDLPLPSAPPERRPTVEERLAEIERLKSTDLISEEERAKVRADVLADVTRE